MTWESDLLINPFYYGGGSNPEAAKASQCPVPGAVVIAPLTQSVRNYGSAGGDFTIVGAPVLGPNGATFDGVDDAMYLVSGWSAEFTLVCRVQQTTYGAGTANGAIVSAMHGRPGSTENKGWGYEQYASNKYLLSHGVARTYGGAKDANWHTITITRSGSDNTLYVDGGVAATNAAGITGGDGLVLGSSYIIAFVDFRACIIALPVLYHSALSAQQQADVEAYVAAA